LRNVDGHDIPWLSALELRELYRSRELSQVEVAKRTLERIDRINPSLNAIVLVTPERALEAARAAEEAYGRGEADAPLLGVPFTVKDNIQTKGIRSTLGSLMHKDFVPEIDVPAVERTYAAGGVLLGKTNTPEFGWKGETSNRVYGTTYNPWNLELTPGGSSGGGSAAVAAGLGPLAIGTDGGGSLRIPASFSGVVGVKASHGVVPYVPNLALETMGHIGPLARTVRDAALLLDVIAGPDPRDRLSLNPLGFSFLEACDRGVEGFRCAWSPNLGFAPVNPEVVELTRAAAFALEAAGAIVEEVELGLDDPYDIVDLFFAMASAAPHAENWDETRELSDFGRVEFVERGRTATAAEVGAASARRWQWHVRMQELMEPYDLLLTPTMPDLPFPAGMDGPENVAGEVRPRLSWTAFTYPFNLTGQPAVSVPCGLSASGLPVGLQVVGRWRGDEAVIRGAAAFEAVRPWRHLRPPVDDALRA
jgi:aspartyl-tRNA(Asn)/glutamyl-tRNA(Gln) amidotransferase subunit A